MNNLSDQFMSFMFDCDDSNCATNDDKSNYVCKVCQDAWMGHLNKMSKDDLYEFYTLNQEVLDDEDYVEFMVKELGLEVEDPKEYFKELNFAFFNDMFFSKLK